MVSLDHFIDLSAQNAIKFKSFITTIFVFSFVCESNQGLFVLTYSMEFLHNHGENFPHSNNICIQTFHSEFNLSIFRLSKKMLFTFKCI